MNSVIPGDTGRAKGIANEVKVVCTYENKLWVQETGSNQMMTVHVSDFAKKKKGPRRFRIASNLEAVELTDEVRAALLTAGLPVELLENLE